MRRAALATAVLGCTLAAPASAQLPDDVSVLIGHYGGSYTCSDREHGVFLDLTSLTPNGANGWDVTGVVGIFPILSGLDDRGAAPTGSFTATGKLAPDGALSLTRMDWLFTALGYAAPDLEGRIAIRTFGGFEIRGRPLVADSRDTCSELIVTKFSPEPPRAQAH